LIDKSGWLPPLPVDAAISARADDLQIDINQIVTWHTRGKHSAAGYLVEVARNQRAPDVTTRGMVGFIRGAWRKPVAIPQ
jgi:hypothetical protein